MKCKILLLFSLIYFCALYASAQKAATVKSFTQTTDHIPGNDRRNDFNGVPCALVKVQVVDNIDRIEGNKIGDIVKRGVEKWVYMCKGSRNIRIHFEKHLPVKVMFQDYQINGLESNRVYELVIEIPDAPAPEPNNYRSEITQSQITDNPTVISVDDDVVSAGNTIVNYRFDFSQMRIGSLSARDYFIRNTGNSTTIEGTLNRFYNEIKQTLISSANQESLMHKGYVLSNREPSAFEVIISIKQVDEDGEHDVFGVVLDRATQQEASHLKVHSGGGRGNDLSKNLPRALRKTGEKFGDKLADDILPSVNYKKMDTIRKEITSNSPSEEEMQNVHSDQTIHQTMPMVTPPKALNKSFNYKYEGVTFKCKAKKGYVTITGFDVNAENVTIPGKVEFEGEYYPVREIDTFINGNNYGARKLVIQEGVMIVANYAFVEFRKLVDVTIPNSIVEIGRNAFRNNKGMKFYLPSRINENDLRKGKSINRR